MIEKLNKFWDENFKEFEPIAYELKQNFNERWVRFHALPNSKRYPENEAEYLEIIYRHNKVLAEIGNINNELLIVLSEYAENKVPRKPSKPLKQIIPVSTFWRTVDQREEYGAYWHFHVAKIKPESRELNEIFRLVANDEVGNIILISLESRSVFHPYDGGADVVLESAVSRDLLKEKYSCWLSPYPSGY